MVDALVKCRSEDINLGIWTFHELPRIGESLMLLGAFEGGDKGYTGWKVTDVYHVPVRASLDTPAVCIFVEFGMNAPVTNRPPASYHGQGVREG